MAKTKTKFSDFFDEYSFEIFAFIFTLVIVILIACAILFSPYTLIVAVVVDGIEYECCDYMLNGNIVELHTNCSSDLFSNHTKRCDRFYVTCTESLEIQTETHSNYQIWFGGDNND